MGRQRGIPLNEPLLGPHVIPGDLPFDLIRVGSVVAEGGAQLGIRKPMIGLTETIEIPAETVVGGDELPDIETSPGDARPPARGTISEEDPRTPPYLQALRKQLAGHSGERLAGGFRHLFNSFGDFVRNPEAFLNGCHSSPYTLAYYRRIQWVTMSCQGTIVQRSNVNRLPCASCHGSSSRTR